MEISNIRKAFDFKNANDVLTVIGSATYKEGDIITDMNGQIMSAENNYLGDFYYTEYDNGKVNKNITNCDKEVYSAADALVDETIDSIKTEMNK